MPIAGAGPPAQGLDLPVRYSGCSCGGGCPDPEGVRGVATRRLPGVGNQLANESIEPGLRELHSPPGTGRPARVCWLRSPVGGPGQ